MIPNAGALHPALAGADISATLANSIFHNPNLAAFTRGAMVCFFYPEHPGKTICFSAASIR
jgi:hypothetical protein